MKRGILDLSLFLGLGGLFMAILGIAESEVTLMAFGGILIFGGIGISIGSYLEAREEE